MPQLEQIISGGIVLVVILAVLALLSMWKKVPQDKALVITGLKKRVISGGGGIVVPILERADRISLENMKIDVAVNGALTEQGVGVIADGVCVIKVKSDKESILSAMEQFNTGNESKTINVIIDTAKDVLEGKLREIISKMTMEEIYQDREKFAGEVQKVATYDLSAMGLSIKAFTITDISDNNGYLEALGKKRIAEVKRDAQIAEAEASKQTKIKTAEADAQGEQARIKAETEIAEFNKEKELKVQAYLQEQETKKAEADQAYNIRSNIAKKEVAETELQIEITKKQKEIELAKQEALRKEEELTATVKMTADAKKYEAMKEAEARKFEEIQKAEAYATKIKLEGNAKAEAVRAEGLAEVEIIREKGLAEAEAMTKKAEAYKLYNDAAIVQMIIEQLPGIATSISNPLSKTEKIVVIDNGNKDGKSGAAKVSGYVTDIMAQLPQSIEALTGMNMLDLIKKGKSTLKDIKIESDETTEEMTEEKSKQ